MEELYVQDIAESQEKRIKEDKESSSVVLPGKVKTLLVVGFVVLVYLLVRNGWVLDDTIYSVGGLLLLIMFYFQFANEDVHDKILPEDVIKAMIYSKLKLKQRVEYDGDYEVDTEARILPSGIVRLRWRNGSIWKWQVGFDFVYRTHIDHMLIEANPFTGMITSIKRIPEGFYGNETVDDVKWIHSPDVMNELRYNKLFEKKKKS